MGALKEPPRLNEEELPEARVPTNLVRNQVHILSGGPITAALFDVGPYRVLRGLVRAPQAWLVEATGPAGDRAILHLVHCRGVKSRADELERQAFQSELASATVGLFDEPGFSVQAHGHVQREDGSRVLFWALPWHDGALHLNTPGSTIRDVEHLLDVCIALADRTGRRHDRQRLDPLLSEQLVAVSPGGADLLGVPIFVPPGWLAPEMPSCRMAPEEIATLEPTNIGDIWRLGQTLTGLAARFEAIPSALSNLLKWMTHEDPRKRPPRAFEVRVECASLKDKLNRAHLTRPQPAVPRPSLSFDEVSQLIMVTLGPTGELAVGKFKEMQILHGEEEVTLAGSVNVKELDKPPSPTGVPPWAFFFSASEFERFLAAVKTDLERRRLGHRIGTGVVQLIAEDGAELEYLGLSEVARTCFRSDPNAWSQIVAADFGRQIGENAETMDDSRAVRRQPADKHEEPTQRIQEHHPRPTIDPPSLLDQETEPPSAPPPPQPKNDRVTITVGGAVDLHAIVEKNETIPERSPLMPVIERPQIVGPNPTSPYAGTLPSAHQADNRVPDSLRHEPVAQAPADDLPFQETLPSPGHPNRVPEELRAQAQANLHPKTGTLFAPGPVVPNQMVRALAFPRPQMPQAPLGPPPMIAKGHTIAAGSPAAEASMRRPMPAAQQTPEPSLAEARPGALRNALVALLLILTIGAIIGAIVFAERPSEEDVEPSYTQVTLDGEIVLRTDPSNAVVVGEDDGRILGQAPLRFLLPKGAEIAVLVASPGRAPRRVSLTGAGSIQIALEPLPKSEAPCSVPFTGARAADLSGVTGNMKVDGERLEFAGASIVRTKPGSRQSGAWIVQCPKDPAESVTLEPRPIEPAELRITQPESAVAYVEGQPLGMIPVTLTVPAAFTKVAIDAGHGARGPLWVPVRGPTEIALGSVPEDLIREIKEQPTRRR